MNEHQDSGLEYFQAALINLTPHTLDICGAGGNLIVSLPASGAVARLAAPSENFGNLPGDIPLYRQIIGAVEGLPDAGLPGAGPLYIVSMPVRLAVPDRSDVASPGDLIRDAAGQPVGCKGLIVNR